MNASGLIRAVRKRRPLWDPLDIQHHNRAVIASLWAEVGREVGLNLLESKSKWRGLRDYYRQMLKRRAGGVPCPSWSHFQEMSFLEETMSCGRPTKHSVGQFPTPDLLYLKSEPDEDLPLFEQTWDSPDSQPTSEQDVLDELEDDLAFFRSLLPDLRGLSRQARSSLRLKIHQVIHQEVYGTQQPSF